MEIFNVVIIRKKDFEEKLKAAKRDGYAEGYAKGYTCEKPTKKDAKNKVKTKDGKKLKFG